jgi:hypothetical protein
MEGTEKTSEGKESEGGTDFRPEVRGRFLGNARPNVGAAQPWEVEYYSIARQYEHCRRQLV